MYLRENSGHRVGPVFGLHFRVGDNVQTVVPEFVSEEEIGEVELADDDDKVEDLAGEEPQRVEAVRAAVQPPILDNVVDLTLSRVRVKQGFLKTYKTKLKC